jgi:hypothetical protein
MGERTMLSISFRTTLVTKHNMLVRCEKPTKTNLRPQLTFSKQSVFVEEEVARTKI